MREESRKRSIDNLQRVYTVVISLAITESLRRLLSQFGDTGQLPDYASILAVISLIVTVIPFYHGANRYLDSTYVTGERSAKSGALMLDFIAIFVEGLAFFILSILVRNTTIFFTFLAALFLFDSFWVWLTRLTSDSQTDSGTAYYTWATANIVAALLLLLSFWSNLLQWNFWPSPTIQVTAAGAIAVIRTVFDYGTVWNFYYPPTLEAKYIMPIPRPAPAPAREKESQEPDDN